MCADATGAQSNSIDLQASGSNVALRRREPVVDAVALRTLPSRIGDLPDAANSLHTAATAGDGAVAGPSLWHVPA